MDIFCGSYLTETEIASRIRSCGRDVHVSQFARIVGEPKNLILHDRVRIDDFVKIVVGTDHVVEIGDDVHVGGHASIHGQAGVTIGAGTHVSAGVRIFSVSDGVDPAPVSIGRKSVIGANAVVLPGVTIGDQTVIGAGSVCLPGQRFWDDYLYAGNPAMMKKSRRV